mgnify:CR=1 FL=1
MEAYKDLAISYDRLTNDVDYEAVVDFYHEILNREGIQPRTAVDLACGTGVLCRILYQSGIVASGMDFSAGMIDIARAESPDIPYDVADMTVYRPDAQFDLVTCTGDAVNHIGDLADVKQIFQNVYTA